jgi:hypothetical protein
VVNISCEATNKTKPDAYQKVLTKFITVTHIIHNLEGGEGQTMDAVKRIHHTPSQPKNTN